MRDQLIEHLKFAAELGVAGVSKDPAWRTRLQGAADSRQTNADDEPLKSEPVMFLTRETLADIKGDIGDDCRRCKLHKLGRIAVGFGVGNPDADLMFVGEAPGAYEDE